MVATRTPLRSLPFGYTRPPHPPAPKETPSPPLPSPPQGVPPVWTAYGNISYAECELCRSLYIGERRPPLSYFPNPPFQLQIRSPPRTVNSRGSQMQFGFTSGYTLFSVLRDRVRYVKFRGAEAAEKWSGKRASEGAAVCNS